MFHHSQHFKLDYNEILVFLLGAPREFEALDSDPSLVKTIDSHSPVSRLIQLKVGAQVGLFILILRFW